MKITIDNKDYELDINKALADKLLIPLLKHKCGSIYRDLENPYGSMYLLTIVDGRGTYKVSLISLGGVAARFKEPTIVDDPTNISSHEWSLISHNRMEFVGENFESVFVERDGLRSNTL